MHLRQYATSSEQKKVESSLDIQRLMIPNIGLNGQKSYFFDKSLDKRNQILLDTQSRDYFSIPFLQLLTSTALGKTILRVGPRNENVTDTDLCYNTR